MDVTWHFSAGFLSTFRRQKTITGVHFVTRLIALSINGFREPLRFSFLLLIKRWEVTDSMSVRFVIQWDGTWEYGNQMLNILWQDFTQSHDTGIYRQMSLPATCSFRKYVLSFINGKWVGEAGIFITNSCHQIKRICVVRVRQMRTLSIRKTLNGYYGYAAVAL